MFRIIIIFCSLKTFLSTVDLFVLTSYYYVHILFEKTTVFPFFSIQHKEHTYKEVGKIILIPILFSADRTGYQIIT